MRDIELERIAQRAGLATAWTDAFGAQRRVAPDTLRALLDVLHVDGAADAAGAVPRMLVCDASRPLLQLPEAMRRAARRARVTLENGGCVDCGVRQTRDGMRLLRALPPGYHEIDVGGLHCTLAAAPPRCFTPADATAAARPRLWGVAVQLYGLRRSGDLGVGDFTALAQFARAAADRGADAVAISPVHALFAADPGKFSPYAPSNRCFLNTVHAAADAFAPGAKRRAAIEPRIARDLAALRRARLIDWPRAFALHRRVFEREFARFAAGATGGAAAFERFRADRGNALAQHACFEALDAYRRRSGGAMPAQAAAAAHAFAHAETAQVRFHEFLQWRSDAGLAAAQADACAAGMRIGLVADLAVGVDPDGSECWTQPQDMLVGAAIGAPPDQLNALGQDWGLTTFSPFPLLHNGYAPFLAVLRAAMRHAGGVRLDHVMGLMRLWLVPRGARATEGAYLRYPSADLLRLVALESWRHRCIVIGEDLGTVPNDWRARLARAGVLGLDVLAFTREGDAFLPPRRWRESAVAMTSTHDLPPVAGWWRGTDLDWRRRLGLFGAAAESDERSARARDRAQFGRRFLPARRGLANAERAVDAAIDAVARTPSALALVPLEDLLGAAQAPNLPGTVHEHPNWRRRYPGPARRLLDRHGAAARVRRLATIRKRR